MATINPEMADQGPITRKLLTRQLEQASEAAIRFGSRFITNTISKNIRYTIEYSDAPAELSSGYGNFPAGRPAVEKYLTKAEAIDRLFLDGFVPIWIDISVSGSNAGRTTLYLLCSGALTDERENLHYRDSGSFPFGIKSPRRLPWLSEGRRYRLLDIHHPLEKLLNKARWWYHRWRRGGGYC